MTFLSTVLCRPRAQVQKTSRYDQFLASRARSLKGEADTYN